jgi:hypothetical protein
VWLCECVKTRDQDIYVANFTDKSLKVAMEGSPMHQTLVATYDKLFAGAAA